MEDCIFCKIINGELPCHKIYEDENVISFLDLFPVNHGHTLVIPKRHAETIFDLTEKEAKEVMAVAWHLAKKLKTTTKASGLNLVQSNYAEAGQEVPHFHIHLIPRHHNDKFGIQWNRLQTNQGDLAKVAQEIISLP